MAGRDVEQGWDPVGDPVLVFLLEQSGADGAGRHAFHDFCEDSKESKAEDTASCGCAQTSTFSYKDSIMASAAKANKMHPRSIHQLSRHVDFSAWGSR